ncbi:MAG: hypothetical protein VKK04_14420 [Synechococcales bacterium]|nr:hypothetical protein [Synechococcales bacterium]
MPIDTFTRLTFWLVVRDRHFANYTNLPFIPLLNRIYYFSNLSTNADNHLFLTRPLKAYTKGEAYPLEHLVVYKNSTLVAIRPQASAAKTPEIVSATPNHSTRRKNWLRLPKSQYVSAQDQQVRQGWSHAEEVPDANPGSTHRFTLVDAAGQTTFVTDIRVPESHLSGTTFPVSLNFFGQHTGHYQLLLDGEPHSEFVIVDPTEGRDAFALLEVVLYPALLPEAFQPLAIPSPSKPAQIQPKTYVIRFKNRTTRWRYHYPIARPHGFTNHLPANFERIDNKRTDDITYATNYPIGLRKTPDLLKDGNDKLLPAPQAGAIALETDSNKTVTAIFSDIYL